MWDLIAFLTFMIILKVRVLSSDIKLGVWEVVLPHTLAIAWYFAQTSVCGKTAHFFRKNKNDYFICDYESKYLLHKNCCKGFCKNSASKIYLIQPNECLVRKNFTYCFFCKKKKISPNLGWLSWKLRIS